METKQRIDIPEKLYFKIGEVSELIGVEPYVLRYWETEFPEISPSKSKTKQRLYKRNDVELIARIRDLLYHDNFTIKGARQKIKDDRVQTKAEGNVQQVKLELEAPRDDKAMIDRAKLAVVAGVIAEMEEFLKD